MLTFGLDAVVSLTHETKLHPLVALAAIVPGENR